MPATIAIGMIEVMFAIRLCGKQTIPFTLSISTKSLAPRLSNVTRLMNIFPVINRILSQITQLTVPHCSRSFSPFYLSLSLSYSSLHHPIVSNMSGHVDYDKFIGQA